MDEFAANVRQARTGFDDRGGRAREPDRGHPKRRPASTARRIRAGIGSPRDRTGGDVPSARRFEPASDGRRLRTVVVHLGDRIDASNARNQLRSRALAPSVSLRRIRNLSAPDSFGIDRHSPRGRHRRCRLGRFRRHGVSDGTLRENRERWQWFFYAGRCIRLNRGNDSGYTRREATRGGEVRSVRNDRYRQGLRRRRAQTARSVDDL
jgi:hypothetical protein